MAAQQTYSENHGVGQPCETTLSKRTRSTVDVSGTVLRGNWPPANLVKHPQNITCQTACAGLPQRRLPRILAFLFVLSVTGCASTGFAYNLLKTPNNVDNVGWAANVYPFFIDSNMYAQLQSSFNPSVAQGDMFWWIWYAASQWRERTGADINFQFMGTVQAVCGVQDGISIIGVISGNCGPTFAVALPWFDGNEAIIEADICVCPSVLWSTTTPPPQNVLDFVGVMSHEFGHAIGLDHTDHTVMHNGTNVPFGISGVTAAISNTLIRYPYGDDILGVRRLYGTRSLGRYWTEHDPNTSTWLPSHPIPSSSVNMHTTGALGRDGNQRSVAIISQLHHNGTVVHFTRAELPLSSGSTWINRNDTYESWRPPGIQCNSPPGDSMCIAAINRALVSDLSQTNIRIMTTDDAFDTAVRSNLGTSHRTMNSPAVVHDPISDCWAIFYTAHDSAVVGEVGRIKAVTSLGGNQWGTVLDLGFTSVDSPSAACRVNQGVAECMLAYVNGGTTARVTTQAFSFFAPHCSMSVGSPIALSTLYQRTPSLTARQWTPFSPPLWMSLLIPANQTDWAEGSGRLWSANDPNIPFGPPNITDSGVHTHHPGWMVGSQYESLLYMAFANP